MRCRRCGAYPAVATGPYNVPLSENSIYPQNAPGIGHAVLDHPFSSTSSLYPRREGRPGMMYPPPCRHTQYRLSGNTRHRATPAADPLSMTPMQFSPRVYARGTYTGVASARRQGCRAPPSPYTPTLGASTRQPPSLLARTHVLLRRYA